MVHVSVLQLYMGGRGWMQLEVLIIDTQTSASYFGISYLNRKDEDDNKDVYRYSGKYWEMRRDPGFMKMYIKKLF